MQHSNKKQKSGADVENMPSLDPCVCSSLKGSCLFLHLHDSIAGSNVCRNSEIGKGAGNRAASHPDTTSIMPHECKLHQLEE